MGSRQRVSSPVHSLLFSHHPLLLLLLLITATCPPVAASRLPIFHRFPPEHLRTRERSRSISTMRRSVLIAPISSSFVKPLPQRSRFLTFRRWVVYPWEKSSEARSLYRLSGSISTNKRQTLKSASMSSLTRSRNEPENDEVYFLLGYHRGTVGYRMCKFDVSAIDESCNHNGNQSSSVDLPPKPFTPVFELPRELYPNCMGAFSLGSKIYMLGGEIPLPGCRHPSGLKHWLRLSEKVYVFDTDSTGSGSSFINLLEVGPTMNGGKTRPFPIHVDGKVYVISQLPAGWIRFNEEYPAVLFEVFDPNYKNNRNEGKGGGGGGKWSTLPNPPFYPDMSQPGILNYGWIVSHAVVGSTIFFCVEGIRKCIYTFDVVGAKWECFDLPLHFPEGELGCFKGAVHVSDSVWAFIGNSRSLVHTYNPRADFGMVGRTVEDLDGVSLVADTPPLLCRDAELVVLKNGRLCVLHICLDEHYYKPGKKLYVLASVFSLVEKRVDKVSRREVVPWLPHMYTPDETQWTSEEVGELKVFGSIGLRSSLFAVDEEGSGEEYYLLGCFPA